MKNAAQTKNHGLASRIKTILQIMNNICTQTLHYLNYSVQQQ